MTVGRMTLWARLAERDAQAAEVAKFARVLVPRLDDVVMPTSTLALVCALRDAVERFDAVEVEA